VAGRQLRPLLRAAAKRSTRTASRGIGGRDTPDLAVAVDVSRIGCKSVAWRGAQQFHERWRAHGGVSCWRSYFVASFEPSEPKQPANWFAGAVAEQVHTFGSGVRLPATLSTRQKSRLKQTESLQRRERRMSARPDLSICSNVLQLRAAKVTAVCHPSKLALQQPRCSG